MASLLEIPITKIATDLGIKKASKNKYHCFNHDGEDKSPSLILYDPGYFKCMSCHLEGSRFKLVQYKLKLKDIKEAKKWMGKQYGITAPAKEEKLHLRLIQNQSKKEEHRFIMLPEEELDLRNPTEEDIQNIRKKLGKSYTVPKLLSADILIADGVGRAKWSALVFRPNIAGRGIDFNPKNKDKILHLEGRTDWLTAIEMDYQKSYCVRSDYNKTSINVSENKLNIFILDSDTEENFILEKIKVECDVKFIRLSKKDLSDLYNAGPEEAKKEVDAQLKNNPLIELMGDGKTLDEVRLQIEEDRIQTKDAELEPIPIMKIGEHLLLSQGNIGTIAGSEGVMKSTFARMVVAGAVKNKAAPDWQNFADINIFGNENGKAVLFFDSEQSKHRQGKNLKEILMRSRNMEVPENFYAFDLVSVSPEEFQNKFRSYVRVAAKIHKGINLILIDQIGDMLANVNDISEVHELMNFLQKVSREYSCGVIGIIHFNPGSEKERGHVGSEIRRKSEFNVFIKRDEATGCSELNIRKSREANEWDIPIMRFAFDKDKGHVVDKGMRPRNVFEGNHLRGLVRELYKSREEIGLTFTEIITFMELKGVCKGKAAGQRLIKKMIGSYDMLRKEGDGRKTQYFIHEDVLITENKNEEINWEEQ